jgi:hypothetical protein
VNQLLVTKLSIFLLCIGLMTAFAGWGPEAALGFAAGGAFSVVNYRALHRVVSSIGTEEGIGARGSAIFFALRYLVLLAVGYVIVMVSETSLRAAMAGLFVSIAAVLVASLYELYAGT